MTPEPTHYTCTVHYEYSVRDDERKQLVVTSFHTLCGGEVTGDLRGDKYMIVVMRMLLT